MYRKYALLTGFSVGLGLAGPGFAEETADQIAAIPGSVEDVRIGGSWEDGGQSGAYRILVARSGGERITARLFVQWIAYGDSGEATVRDSIEITELAEMGVDIADFTAESDADGLSVFVETVGEGGVPEEAYELHVFSPTDYLFGPASN
jgi:hypothetical protein